MVRNVICNLAWTDPSENTVLQQDISLAMVENVVIDTFMDPTMHEPTDSDGVGGDPDECDPSTIGANTARDATMAKKRVWRVPERPPQFLHVPIVVTSTETQLEKGKFKRFGMDCIVNGVWLAMYWAMLDEDAAAISALERLLLNWPFDFQLFEAPPEVENREAILAEKILAATANLPLETERLRDFFGFTAKNMMLVCGKVKEILKLPSTGKQEPKSRASVRLDGNKW